MCMRREASPHLQNFGPAGRRHCHPSLACSSPPLTRAAAAAAAAGPRLGSGCSAEPARSFPALQRAVAAAETVAAGRWAGYSRQPARAGSRRCRPPRGRDSCLICRPAPAALCRPLLCALVSCPGEMLNVICRPVRSKISESNPCKDQAMLSWAGSFLIQASSAASASNLLA